MNVTSPVSISSVFLTLILLSIINMININKIMININKIISIGLTAGAVGVESR